MVHIGQSVEITPLDEVALHAAHGIVVAGGLVIDGDIVGRIHHRGKITVGLHARLRIERYGRLTRPSLLGGDDDDTVAAPRTVYGRRSRILQYGDVLDIVGRHGIETALYLDAVDNVERLVAGVYRTHAAYTHRHIGTRSTAGRGDLNARHTPLKGELSRRYRNLGEFGTLHLVHRTEHVALALYRVTDHHQLLYLVGSHIQRDINDGTSSDRHRTGFVPQIGEFERTILGHIVQFIRTVHVGRNPVRGSRHDDTHPYERFAGLGIGHDTLDRSGLLRRNGYQRNRQDKTKKKQ